MLLSPMPTARNCSMDKISTDYLKKLIEEADTVLSTHKPNSSNVIGFPTLDSGAFSGWRAKSLSFLKQRLIHAPIYSQDFEQNVKQGYRSSVQSGKGILASALAEIEEGPFISEDNAVTASPLRNLEIIFNNFHRVARQLRSRHADRPTLNISDEYDVQDLLHSMLHLYFSDVRAEEYTPSYANGSSRTDFLLKNEEIIIEIKMTRNGLKDKQLANELIIDKERYSSHPNCSALVCFIYDPLGLISNPSGLINDLEQDEPFPVRVLVEPKL